MYSYYTEFFELRQQRINYNLYQIGVPSDEPVHMLKRVMQELDFSCLLDQYSRLGRRGYNPIMLFSVLVYSALRGVRAVDRIVELCTQDIAYIWIAQGEKPQRDAFYDFMNNKFTNDILKELHYQFMRKLQKEGLVSLEALYIDGTKMEANANRYTFVCRGSLNYRLVGLLDSIQETHNHYNAFITENDYNVKYTLPLMQMFMIEGKDKVREVIKKNRARKNNKKKLSNNTLIEIDNMSPLEMLRVQDYLKKIAENENIAFATGKGQRKHDLQKLYEKFNEQGLQLLNYKEAFKVMRTTRNSYSKTDLEATFMRMKDDHMVRPALLNIFKRKGIPWAV